MPEKKYTVGMPVQVMNKLEVLSQRLGVPVETLIEAAVWRFASLSKEESDRITLEFWYGNFEQWRDEPPKKSNLASSIITKILNLFSRKAKR